MAIEVRSITLKNSEYPNILKEIDDKPQRLWLLGAKLKDEIRLTVVGSRRPSSYGEKVTREIVKDLASAGVTIVSGLAIGIDSIAHQAALDAKGKAIAVMPAGLHAIYPASNRMLAKKIIQKGGTLVSEYPIGQEPRKYHFVARNRIQSGLSHGVLIIEATEKSGTLITAQFALDQNRTVMAVPGQIFSPNSTGTNQLIKDGAVPVMSAQDVLEALGISTKLVQRSAYIPESSEEEKILSLIKQGIYQAEEIMQKTKLEAALFNTTLTLLEIKGVLTQNNPGEWDFA
jgi:DNA processing protein